MTGVVSRWVDGDITARAISRADLVADVQAINASLDIIRTYTRR